MNRVNNIRDFFVTESAIIFARHDQKQEKSCKSDHDF